VSRHSGVQSKCRNGAMGSQPRMSKRKRKRTSEPKKRWHRTLHTPQVDNPSVVNPGLCSSNKTLKQPASLAISNCSTRRVIVLGLISHASTQATFKCKSCIFLPDVNSDSINIRYSAMAYLQSSFLCAMTRTLRFGLNKMDRMQCTVASGSLK
jgi:hypothetical protein